MRVLTDENMQELVAKGDLFKPSTFSPKNCRGVFYDLRLAPGRYYSTNKAKFISLSQERPLVLEPGECVWALTLEELDFKSGRYCGLLFSVVALLHVGVSHIATTIDPGFDRQLVISLINHSNRPKTSPLGRVICKLMIIELDKVPERPWVPDAWWESFPENIMPPNLEEPWHPVNNPNTDDLERVVQVYGPPYDIISPLLAKATRGAEESLALTNRVEALDDRVSVLDSRLSGMERSMTTLDDVGKRSSQIEATVARLEGLAEEREQKVSWQRNVLLTLIVLLVGMLCGIVSSILGAVVQLAYAPLISR
jgi:deoxycytidine triphosphate deaminase